MRLPRTAVALPITAKEFAQWLAPLQTHCNNQAQQRALSRTGAQHRLITNRVEESNPIDQPLFTAAFELGNEDTQNIGIAVSGGVDSMALVTLLARHYRSFKNDSKDTKLHALIVDHKLRDNSTEEAAFVAEQVKMLSMWWRPMSIELMSALNPLTPFVYLSLLPTRCNASCAHFGLDRDTWIGHVHCDEYQIR